MIQDVEAFDEEVVGFVDIFIQTGAVVQKTPGEFAFFRNLLLGEEIGRFFAVFGRCCGGRGFGGRRVRGRGFSGMGSEVMKED